MFTEAVSLGILEPPADADIVAGELQSFAISPSYGGPYRGHHRHARRNSSARCPAAWSAKPRDSRGNRAFCLTLATREQHIRREKATSNICTNQALIALMATVFMTRLRQAGPARARRAESGQGALSGGQAEAALHRPVLQRVRRAVERPTPEEVNKALLKKKIIGGLPLGRFYPELADCMLLVRHRNDDAARHMDEVAAGVHSRSQQGLHDQKGPHPHHAKRGAAVRAQLARQEGLSASRARCARRRPRRRALGAAQRARRNRRISRRSAKSKPSATSRASPPGTTPSTTACIRSAPAP